MKPGNSPSTKVWDLPTRLWHWSLASLFVFLIVSAELGGQLMRYHILSGCLLSGLIIFRVIWGFGGGHHARFSYFVRTPKVVLKYLQGVIQGKPSAYLGHNPAGAIMVLVLILTLSVQTISGLVTTDDILWSGPLYRWANDNIAELGRAIHNTLGIALKVLVALHILAVLVHQYYLKEPIVGAMLHGYKPLSNTNKPEADKHYLTLGFALSLSGLWVAWLWSLPL